MAKDEFEEVMSQSLTPELLEKIKNNDPTLDTLVLNVNNDEEVIRFSEALDLNSNLKRLRLHVPGPAGNPLGKGAVAALTNVLSKNTSLDNVHLDFRMDNSVGPGTLFNAIRMNLKSAVKILKLSGMRIGLSDFEALTDLLKDPNCTLTTLDIPLNQLDSRGVEVLAQGLLQNRTVHTVNLAGNQLGNIVASALARVLRNPDSILQNLNVSHSKIDDQGIKELVEAILQNPNPALKHFNLSLNEITGVSAPALARLTAILQTLDLSNNRLGNEGAVILVQALNSESPLQILNLGRNSINEQGAQKLTELVTALGGNSLLQSLSVYDDGVDWKSQEMINSILEHNNELLQKQQVLWSEMSVAIASHRANFLSKIKDSVLQLTPKVRNNMGLPPRPSKPSVLPPEDTGISPPSPHRKKPPR